MMKNRGYHEGIMCSPYEAMFGSKARIGLKTTSLPTDVISRINTEEELAEIISDINQRSTITESNVQGNDDQAPIIEDQKEEIKGNALDAKEDESQTKNITDMPSQHILAIEAEEKIADNIHHRQHLIRDKRKMVVTNLKIRANRMKSLSLAKHPEGKIGKTVRIPIPDVDRARGDLCNVLVVIIAVEDNNYSIGTKEGKLKRMYSRNQFTICKESMVAVNEVPENVEISLRECVRKFSSIGGQGYYRCFCNQKCKTKKCKCRNSRKLCNSKCHNSNPCFNKDN